MSAELVVYLLFKLMIYREHWYILHENYFTIILKVQSDLPFLHSSDEEQLNYLCRLGTHYLSLITFIRKYGSAHSLPNPGL